MIILDTDVFSAITSKKCSADVIEWLDKQPIELVYITSVTIYEDIFGFHLLPDGQKKKALQFYFDAAVSDLFRNRVLAFDYKAAEYTALLAANRRKSGFNVPLSDTLIAGIATAWDATVVTRNTKHFSDLKVPVVNPWRE